MKGKAERRGWVREGMETNQNEKGRKREKRREEKKEGGKRECRERLKRGVKINQE